MTLRLFYDTVKPAFSSVSVSLCDTAESSCVNGYWTLPVAKQETKSGYRDRNAVCHTRDIIVFRDALLTKSKEICGVKLNVIFHESAQMLQGSLTLFPISLLFRTWRDIFSEHVKKHVTMCKINVLCGNVLIKCNYSFEMELLYNMNNTTEIESYKKQISNNDSLK